MKSIARIVAVLFVCLSTFVGAMGQDPMLLHPESYKVEIDNEKVRVIHAYHKPHEKVAMHSHPASVIVYLTDVHQRTTLPNGKSSEATHHAGEVAWSGPRTHTMENLADTPMEVLEIEIKPFQNESSGSKNK
jgi:hypothetical protein